MKKMLLLLTLFLAACGAPAQSQDITGPQALQTIQVGELVNTFDPTDTEPAAPVMPVAINDAAIAFTTQDEFVQFMADELHSLEGTLLMLDANLGEALSSDAPAPLLSLRDFMIQGARQDQAELENIPPYNEAVVNLQTYVGRAFHYSMEQKAAEYGIFSTDSLEERSKLLVANAENEQNATRYITLARQEIVNLTGMDTYRK
ncbi:MAG: hypothetical protein FWF59_10185 [Turicibacter sp.]|nr:hypothetical protein [Turicibacter sp.]